MLGLLIVFKSDKKNIVFRFFIIFFSVNYRFIFRKKTIVFENEPLVMNFQKIKKVFENESVFYDRY